MDKRAGLRQFYTDQAIQQARDTQHSQTLAKSDALESTVVDAFNALIRYLEGHTSKTEVVNQLRSISTPDVDKVVTALSKLDTDILTNQLDLQPLLNALDSIQQEIATIPKDHAEPVEQLETVKVSNLADIQTDFTPLLKAIKELKLNPTIDVKTPVVNVEKTDLKPLQDALANVVKAVKDQTYPKMPVTDLKTLEKNAAEANKKLDEANKHLKLLVAKPVSSGGGGGSGTPYTDSTGKPVYVPLSSGAIPVAGSVIAPSLTNWTSATTVNAANTISVGGLNTVTVTMSNTGTMTGGVLTFEASPDNITWFPIAMARIDSYTVETVYILNVVTNRAWSSSVDGFSNFRVRLSTVIAGTGTATINVTPQTFAIEPIVTVGQVTGTNLHAVVDASTPATSTTTSNTISSAATTNATLIKATAANLYSIVASNTGAAAAYLKLYNKATAPTVGTDLPILTIPIAPSGIASVQFGVLGHRLSIGLSLAVTNLVADTDVTAVALAQVKIMTEYI